MTIKLHSWVFALTSILVINIAIAQGQCDQATFRELSLFGIKIQNIATTTHSGISLQIPSWQNHYAKNVTGLDACEVAITYTHPSYDDTINTVLWLPTPEHWTGRFLGNGGGGWAASAEGNATFAWAASEGFAVVSTDGGHVGQAGPEVWALLSPGNLNWNLLTDFASTSLDEAATLGKAVTRMYYGRAPDYSYWNGCSQGGRQGYMMAQRYPEQYDGILATAPAIGYGQVFMQFYWAQAVMNDLGNHLTSFPILVSIFVLTHCRRIPEPLRIRRHRLCSYKSLRPPRWPRRWDRPSI